MITLTHACGHEQTHTDATIVADPDWYAAQPCSTCPKPRADRVARSVGAALGMTTPATGRCHYCGQPLNRRGDCEECV